ncbi:MAG: hypothetical protein AAFV45_08100 [Pseudomonadota bacterium]
MTTKHGDLFAGSITTANAQTASDLRSAGGFGHMLGFLVVAILPAAFWTAILHIVTGFMGTSLSFTVLGCVFTAIAAFLGVIFAAIARTSSNR